MITVFTPTYNRKKELGKLYNSLLNQEFKDFEWVIVDDGSTDGTEEIVKEFVKENKININYFKQENRGKSIAHNKGVQLAKGNYFVGIDSDSTLKKNALEIVNKYYEMIKDKEDICGIAFVNIDIKTNEVSGTKFPNDVLEETYFNIYNKHHVTGDKEMTFKTNIIKQYPFPEIKGEKFVPESLIFNRICKKYKFLCVNEAIQCVQYLEDGYSLNYFNLAKKNPIAHMINYKELYDLDKSLYNIAAYNMYSIYAKYGFWKTIKEHPAKLKCLFMYIPAYIKYLQKERNK